MIVDYEYNPSKKILIVSYIDKFGKIKLKHYPWTPTKFIQTSDDDPERDGRMVTWWGAPVKEIYSKYPNKYSVYDFLDSLPEEEQKILFDYNEPDIFFVDIENEILDSKPRPELAESKILSISIIYKNKAVVLGLDPLSAKEERSIQTDINNEYGSMFNREWEFKYIHFPKGEYDMLLTFFTNYVPKMPVITGWNFKHYDWVFLVNRCRKLGIKPELSSFTGQLIEDNKNDPKNYCELPSHRMVIDYMEIFDKWDTSIKVKESNSLDFVASKVLKVKKVNYEGNLKILYETDFKKFIFYNAVDSILVQMIHEKSKLADILYGIATLSRTTVTKALSTLSVTEGILRKKLRDKKNIVLVKNDIDENATSVKGGWVKEPVRGMATWTCCFDFSSLYPTCMRQFNISADSYKGQKIKDKPLALFNGHEIDLDPTDIITKNGAVFRNEVGVVTDVLTEIFSSRKSYKKKMMGKNIELDALKRELKELEDSLID